MAKPPAHEIRFGLVKAVIWQNQTKNGERYTVSLVRLYRNGDRWVESQQFGRNELPLVAKAADMAHTWIYQQGGRED